MIKDRTMQSLLFVFFIPIHIVKAIRKYISDPELRITHIMTNQNDYFTISNHSQRTIVSLLKFPNKTNP